tara:strand:+ start:1679 stop:2647 length:969 start_codon:yes stop_codon:yes gene_type:complete
MLNSYWEYAGTRYRHKFRAIEASHGDIQNISFKMFENKTFQNFDWSIEPAQSFKSLMKLRALQLRDSYPYLKFCFSGGADSTTVLKVFLENNIFINEIVVWKFGNNLSNYEIDQYTIPYLKQLQKDIPKTKITIYTYNYDYFQKYFNDKWFFTKSSLCPRHPYLPKINGNNYCYIFSHIDPMLEYENGEYYCTFYDTSGAGELTGLNNIELFYTSPDFPELHAKQVHVIKKHLKPTSTFEDQKIILRKYLRDEPIAPTPDFLLKDWGNLPTMHFQRKTIYIHKEMGRSFSDKYRYLLNTKINGLPAVRGVLGYSDTKIPIGV